MKLKTSSVARNLGLAFLFLFINFSLSHAQVIRCATMQMDSMRRANNPGLQSEQDFEDWLNKAIVAKKNAAQNSLIINGVYQIPVIVHVIHNGEAVGTGTNLSQAVIQSQIDVLNEDFRRIFGTNGYNTHPDGADTEIEFCLARRRPDGTAFPAGEDGINRINRNSLGWGAPPYATAFIDGTIKPYTIATQGYDAAEYMNFWSVDITGGILGYAQFPTTVLGGMGCNTQNVNTDGVVMLYSSIGKSAVNGQPAPFNEGRTATHEIGHWLGLRHIWGDGGCGVDDFCADTPLSDNPNYGCPTTNSCTDPNGDPNDMVENYMDYTNDLCMNIFTEDQKMRMRTVLENSPIRASLIRSDACIPPAVSDASIIDITSPFGDNCPGTVIPEVTLRNRGSSNLTSATIEYTINGGTPVSFNWTGNIAPGNETSVTLPGSPIFLGTHTLSAYSILPNGVTDPDPTYDTTTMVFAISNGFAPDYSQDFETGVFPPDLRWGVDNPNGDCYEWVGGTGVASDGTSPNDCALMTNYQNGTNADEYLYTPLFILPCNASSAEMAFDVAYRKRVNGSSDRLRVEISLDCGNTWQPTPIYDQQGNGLRTVTANFNGFWIPDAAGDWRNEVIDLSPFVTASSQNVQFRFRATNGGNGGNLYVDNFEFRAVTPGEINVSESGNDIVDGGAYDFGLVGQGSTTTATFTVSNSGTTDLILTAPITITGGAEFSVNTSFGTLTVPAGGSTTFSIDFNPLSAGTFNAVVSFGTNDCDESPFDFFLFGETSTTPPTASFTASPTTICQGTTVTYTDASTGAATWAWTFPSGTPASATGAGPHIITYNSTGTFNAQLDVTNAFGTDTDLQTNVITVLPGTGNALPISEGFVAATFPPTNWSIVNGGNPITWVRDGGNGNAPTAASSAVFDNYNTDMTGDEDDLVMPPADFTGLTSAQLEFDVAYAPYNGTLFDQLDVLISTDCGQSYTPIYSAAGTALQTEPAQTGAYTAPTVWRTETIDLTAYIGNPKVDIIFRNISGYGQYLYLDNINLTGVGGCTNPDVPVVNSSPTTICDGNTATLNISGNLNDATAWSIYSGTCGGTLVGTTAGATFDVTPSTTTTYFVRGEGGCATLGACGSVTVTVTPDDDATFNYSASLYCVNATDPTPTISGTSGGTFTSLPAGLSINASTGVIDVSASAPGVYAVTYTTAGTCPDNSNVAVTISALDDASFNYSASSYCSNDTDPTPTITGLTGGTFSSTAGLSINASTGEIDLSASTPGTYSVTYTTSGACPNSSSVSVTINTLDDASFSYSAASYCVNGSDPTPTVTGVTGGSFSLTPGLSINFITGAIDVSASTPGTYTVTYTTGGACSNSSSVTVTINALDDASFNYSASSYCSNDADPTPTITGLTGGTFSSTAGLSINASTGAIDVSASTPGTYSVTYTTSGACSNSSSATVTINALDDASFSYGAASYCISGVDPTPTITGSTGGTFSSTAGLSINASTGEIDLSASIPGTYSVTYTTSGACSNSSSVSVTINTLDDASFSYSAASYCVNGSDPTPTVTGVTGGSFSLTPGLSINFITGAIDVSASTPGTYTVTYTTGGACSNSSSVTVTINALDDASFNYSASSYCSNDADPTPTITGLTGGTFSSTAGLSISASTGAIDVSASTPGTYTVTYTTGGACSNSSSAIVTINALDDASFSYGAASYCISGVDPTPTITGSTGGTFSSTAGLSINASTGEIDLSASIPGTYSVTYTTSGACSNSSSVSVTINTLDDASFSYSAASYCVNGSDPTPTVTGVTGGSFSLTPGLSINFITGAIDVSASTPGTYTVTYTTGGACSNSSSVTVTINALDDASFNYSASSYCSNDADPTPTITGLTGGTFSSTAGLSINASTGAIDVSASTPGTYSVTYTTSGACSNSSSATVTINALDDASFNYSASSYCSNDADPTPTITGVAGGSFSLTPGLSINFITGAIDVSASTPGTYTVTYTTSGACSNSSSATLTINALDDASFSYGAASYCISGVDPTPTITGSTGGTFSSTAGLSINASTGEIDLSASTPGTYSVTYTTSGACPNSSSVSVTINTLDDASFSYSAASYCVNGSDPTPTVTGVTGGSFSLTPGLSINFITGAIDVSASTPGTYTVTYTTGGACSNSSSVTVTINALDDASFNYSASSYCSNDADPTPAITGLTGGTFSSTAGLSINTSTGAIDVSASTPGTYSVTYTTSGACSNSSSVTVTINALDDASFGYSVASYCVNDADPTPTVTGLTGGTFSSTAGLSINASTGEIDLSASTPGTYSVAYTTSGVCSNSSSVTVTINALDDASFSYSAASYCVNGSDPTPTVTGVTGGSFSLTPGLSINFITGAIDVSASTPGTYTVTYTTGGACSNSSSVTVTINALDDASFNYSASSYCSNDADPTPTITGLTGGTFSSTAGLSINASTGAIDVSASTSGTYTVTYTTSGTCSNTSSTTVTINALPTQPTISASGSTSFCPGGSVTLTSSESSGNVWSTTETTSSINVTTSGAYSVTFTDVNGCSATSNPITVNVYANPAVPTISSSGPTTFCSGGSVDLTSSQPISNVWSTTATSQTVTVNSTGSYTVTYTNSDGCSATSLPVNVVVNANPSAPTITPSGSTTFCDGGSVDLVSSELSGNVWSTTETSQTITATSGGAYSVTYTDANGCSATSAITLLTVNANPPAPSITPSGSTTFCDGGTVDLISSEVSGNTWSTTEVTQLISVNTSGSYTVSYTDANGCSSISAPILVTVNSLPSVPVITPSGATTFCSGGSVDLVSSEPSGNTWSTTATSQLINVNTSGSYTVMFTDGNGCSSTSLPTLVTVNPNPTAPTITANGPTTFCEGDSVILTSSELSGNTWSTAETTESITVNNAGTYAVTYTDGNGCSATSAQVAVTVNALPTVTLAPFADICDHASVFSLSGGTPAGGAYSGTGVSSGMFDPFVAGVGTHTITYTYTDVNGCSNFTEQDITIRDCAGMDELEIAGLSIYPNPTSDYFQIISSINAIENVRVFDASGRLVFAESFDQMDVKVDLTPYVVGMYNIEITTSQDIYRTRMMKQ